MALAPFFGRSGNLWDDDFDFYRPFGQLASSLWDDHPARFFANDARAVARTRVDWVETPESHVFKAELPGLKKEEIKVTVEDGNTLQISGERRKEEVRQTDTWHSVERSQGKFMRRFRLPEDVKIDEVSAKVDDGVLMVTVPKVEKKKAATKLINIS